MHLILERHDGSTTIVESGDCDPLQRGDLSGDLVDVIHYLLDRYAAHETIADTPPPFVTDPDRRVMTATDPSIMTITLRESSNDLHIRAYDDHDSTIRDVYTIPVDALGGLAKLLNGGEYLRGAPRDGGQPVDALASEIATILTHGVPGVFLRRKAKAEPYAMVNEPGILQWVTRHLNPALSGYDLMRGIADGTHAIDNAVLEWCVRGLAAWGKEKRLELRVYDRADTNDPILSHQFSHFVVNGHVVSTRPPEH